MLTVNLFDTEFDHSFKEDGFFTASAGIKPTKIRYVKNLMHFDGITLFTERHLDRAKQVVSKYKVAWLMESPGIHPWSVNLLLRNENHFDYILTTIPELLERGNKYIRSSVGSCRIKEENRSPIKKKNKLCSIIASSKNDLEGHSLRHNVISSCKGIDLWGSGYKKFINKEDALSEYMFSICIMNVCSNNYFTEILTDPMFVGTIPIFWGCPNIEEFFDIDGIIQFSTIPELKKILLTLNRDLYLSKTKAILKNYDLVQDYKSTDDLIASLLLKTIPDEKFSSHYYIER